MQNYEELFPMDVDKTEHTYKAWRTIPNNTSSIQSIHFGILAIQDQRLDQSQRANTPDKNYILP